MTPQKKDNMNCSRVSKLSIDGSGTALPSDTIHPKSLWCWKELPCPRRMAVTGHNLYRALLCSCFCSHWLSRTVAVCACACPVETDRPARWRRRCKWELSSSLAHPAPPCTPTELLKDTLYGKGCGRNCHRCDLIYTSCRADWWQRWESSHIDFCFSVCPLCAPPCSKLFEDCINRC